MWSGATLLGRPVIPVTVTPRRPVASAATAAERQAAPQVVALDCRVFGVFGGRKENTGSYARTLTTLSPTSADGEGLLVPVFTPPRSGLAPGPT